VCGLRPSGGKSLLEEFERSGLSGKKFAELAGIKYQTFATWLQKRRRQGQSSRPSVDPVRWLEAVVDQAQPSDCKNPTGLVMELPGGARVEISDLKQISLAAGLLRALEKPC
jgi:transcriptional regulator with XRE-family HTH domain